MYSTSGRDLPNSLKEWDIPIDTIKERYLLSAIFLSHEKRSTAYCSISDTPTEKLNTFF